MFVDSITHVTANEGVGGKNCRTTRVHMKRNTYEKKKCRISPIIRWSDQNVVFAECICARKIAFFTY